MKNSELSSGFESGFKAGENPRELFDGCLSEKGFDVDYIKAYIDGFIAGFRKYAKKTNKDVNELVIVD
jgi:hypothetical protein